MTPKQSKPESNKQAEPGRAAPSQSSPKKEPGKITAKTVGLFIFLVIIIVAFVFVPPMSRAPDAQYGSSLGSYNGRDINFLPGNYFAQQVSALDQYYDQQGLKRAGDDTYAYTLWKQAFSQMAIHLGTLDDAQGAGVFVTESYLDEQTLKDTDYFEDGVFSRLKYREYPVTQRLAKRDALRENYLKNLYLSNLTGYRPGPKEIELIKEMAKRERTVEYVSFPFSLYPDTERIAYGTANPDKFRRIAVSYITVTTSKAEAETIRKKVADTAMTFADAAKSYSTDMYKSQGGAVGSRWFYELSEDFKKKEDAQALLGIKKGELSPVFETSSGGWRFCRIEEEAKAPDFADPTTLAAVTSYMYSWEKGKIEDYVVSLAKKFSETAAKDFSSAAAKASLTVKSFGPFPLNYGNAFYSGQFGLFKPLQAGDAMELSGIERNEKFLTQMWKTQVGSIAEPVAVADSILVAKIKTETVVEDSTLAMVDYFYGQFLSRELFSDYSQKLLKSPKLKDNFDTVYGKFKGASPTAQ